MPAPLKVLKANVPYVYCAIGVVWLAFVFMTGSLLLLWPVVACLLGGVMLKIWPGQRLTWAWASAAAVMGLLLALYQAYAAVPLIYGAFSMIAGASIVVFSIFAVGHLFLLYIGNTGSRKKV